jgi:hypothetical protein
MCAEHCEIVKYEMKKRGNMKYELTLKMETKRKFFSSNAAALFVLQ